MLSGKTEAFSTSSHLGVSVAKGLRVLTVSWSEDPQSARIHFRMLLRFTDERLLHRFNGNYVDQNGVALTDGGGTLVLETHGDVRAHSA